MADMPVGVDLRRNRYVHALQEEGIKVIDGQQIMLCRARNQELGRDPASDAGRCDGRWRLPHDLRKN